MSAEPKAQHAAWHAQSLVDVALPEGLQSLGLTYLGGTGRHPSWTYHGSVEGRHAMDEQQMHNQAVKNRELELTGTRPS